MPQFDAGQLKTGDRVRAIQKIYHQSFRNVAVEAGTEGVVQMLWQEKGRVAVLWDTGIRFFCSVDTLAQTSEKFQVNPERTLTQSQMLAFQSIFDLLTRLRFEEDTEGQCMVDRGGEREVERVGIDIYNWASINRYIDFDQIAGRTVAEFVREGIQNGFLRDYLKTDEYVLRERETSAKGDSVCLLEPPFLSGY